ncbi:MAG: hypothetical protein Q8M76_11270 [Spirochaetaceae bacterium]|nr:hypothetical protein [Spirochaetaceae bacterium]
MHLQDPAIDKIARKLRRVFDSLEGLPYLGPREIKDFNYFRALFEESLIHIDRKVSSGRLHPLDLRGFPQDLRYPGFSARIGIFIGSFDPFQMTHLAMALRFLASDASEADVVFVVPEGSSDTRKPAKTEYRFRYEILRNQLAGILEPLVVHLDIGEGADTIEIVRRLIAMHRGAHLRLTHLIGSDVLPIALRFIPDDLEAWQSASSKHGVALDFSIHVARRDSKAPLRPLLEAVRRYGVRIVVDRRVIGTPSSTAFRADGAITVVLPTEAVLSRLELLFRYGMNKPWVAASLDAGPRERAEKPIDAPEYEI